MPDYTYESLNQMNQEQLVQVVLSLQKSKKMGWKMFYRQLDIFYQLVDTIRQDWYHFKALVLKNEMRQASSFLVKKYKEMLVRLGELRNCSICLESLNKHELHVGKCGHLCCKSCYRTIPPPKQCPKCRRHNF